MTTSTQKTLHGLLSIIAAQCEHDANLIIQNQENGIAALYLDLDYIEDILAQVDEIADTFTQAQRIKNAH